MANTGPELPQGISVVVPVYNAQDCLATLVARLGPVLEAAAKSFELILVNDGSRDNSWQTIVEITTKTRWTRGINLMRNYGQHNALLCGIREARYDTIVTLDDDLQNPPEEMPRLLSELQAGADVVYGYPEHQQHGIMRDLASVITKIALQKGMGAQTARHISAYRAFRTQIRDGFAEYRGSFVSIDALLTWATSRFMSIPVRHDQRMAGRSNYTLGKLITHAINMMTGFSTIPLRSGSLLGFGFTLFGVGVLAYVLIRYLTQGSAVAGFPFLASVIAIFSGVQLFTLGMIGEYLARMHFRLMDRSPYAIRQVTPPEVR